MAPTPARDEVEGKIKKKGRGPKAMYFNSSSPYHMDMRGMALASSFASVTSIKALQPKTCKNDLPPFHSKVQIKGNVQSQMTNS